LLGILKIASWLRTAIGKRGLRQSGFVEGAATAKLIKRGKVKDARNIFVCDQYIIQDAYDVAWLNIGCYWPESNSSCVLLMVRSYSLACIATEDKQTAKQMTAIPEKASMNSIFG
jgi:hypothetical protein